MSNTGSVDMFAPPPPAPAQPPAGAFHTPGDAGANPPAPSPGRPAEQPAPAAPVAPMAGRFVFADMPSTSPASWRADFAIVLRIDPGQRPTVEVQIPATSAPSSPALQRVHGQIAVALRTWLDEVIAAR